MSNLDKDKDIDNALEFIFDQIKPDIIQKLRDEGENNESNKLTTYKELKASKLYTNDTLFKKLKKYFASTSNGLNYIVPELFQIIDIISMSNIIYQDANSGLVELLLANILFSELKKLDSKVQTFYNSIDEKNESSKSDSQHAPDKATSYKLMNIKYNSNEKKYIVTYPDFLTDAFETIKNKLKKNTEYDEMIEIELKEQEPPTATGPGAETIRPKQGELGPRRQHAKSSYGQAPPRADTETGTPEAPPKAKAPPPTAIRPGAEIETIGPKPVKEAAQTKETVTPGASAKPGAETPPPPAQAPPIRLKSGKHGVRRTGRQHANSPDGQAPPRADTETGTPEAPPKAKAPPPTAIRPGAETETIEPKLGEEAAQRSSVRPGATESEAAGVGFDITQPTGREKADRARGYLVEARTPAKPVTPAAIAQNNDAKAKETADAALNDRRRTWFTNIFGINENSEWNDVVSKFEMDNNTLICSTATDEACKKQLVGVFECLSLKQLKERHSTTNTDKPRISFKVIASGGGVGPLHNKPENNGAVFQVASQFNCLEMFNQYYTPKHGVGVYEDDRTQGPACAMACPAALVYRNYLVKHSNNSVKPNNTEASDVYTGQNRVQIDNLSNLGSIVGNNNKTGGKYWTMNNGYAFLKSRESLLDVTNELKKDSKINEVMEALCVGVHWETSVNPKSVPNTNKVCQVYASALPIEYNNNLFIKDNIPVPSLDEWKTFACVILKASYDATLAVAANKSKDNSGKRIKCFITLIGGGAFENDKSWIREAIYQAIINYQDWPIDVILVHYGPTVPQPVTNYFPEVNEGEAPEQPTPTPTPASAKPVAPVTPTKPASAKPAPPPPAKKAKARVRIAPNDELSKISRNEGQEWFGKNTLIRSETEANLEKAAKRAIDALNDVSSYATSRAEQHKQADHVFVLGEESEASFAVTLMNKLAINTAKMSVAASLVVQNMGNKVTPEAKLVRTQASDALNAVMDALKKVNYETQMANVVVASNSKERDNNIERWKHAKDEARDKREKAMIKVNEVCSIVLNSYNQ